MRGLQRALLDVQEISGSPADYLASVGQIFARFGPATQDSGNLSYGVQLDGQRFFVKTTDPAASAYLDFPERVALLRNAVELNARCAHPALPALLNVIESAAGPMLVYEWVAGELLRARKGEQASAHERFRCLPVADVRAALDTLYDLHTRLADLGYVAVDFYDGCLLYDFPVGVLRVVDLDHYQQGPFSNGMGRMFGSSRFMAPEEFELGARIDEQTTVFNLGRAAAIFMGGGDLDADAFTGGDSHYQVVAKACQPIRADRYGSVAEFYGAWQAAG